MNAKDLIEAARLRVWQRHPYIGAVLMSLRFIEKLGIGTLAIDAGWRMYYDPKTCTEWGIDLLSGVVCHECWHVLRDHFGRREQREPQLWNIANDLEINGDMVKAGWKLPREGMMPKKLGLPDGLLAEEYYQHIEKNSVKVTVTVKVKCGGCAGNPHDFEESNDHGVSSIPSAVKDVIRRQVARDVAKAVSEGQGDIPAGLQAWAERELKPPTINWRTLLASMVRRSISEASGAVDHTYRKQSRRGAGLRHVLGPGSPILPALYRPVPSVAIILDVSGSMSGGPAEAARGEIMGVVRAIGCSIDVFVADTQVAGKSKVSSQKDVAMLGETLGGTDMSSAIREVGAMRKHDVLIVLTDGETGWHSPGDVRARVIAAITPNGIDPPEYVRSVRMV